MLNFINLLRKEKKNVSNTKGGNIRIHKRDIPMSKEWLNSLYSFKSNTARIYPIIYSYVFKLLKAYFNMTNHFLEKNISSYFRKMRRISGYKVWVSNPEMKHYNDKITITIYIYNNTYNFFKKKSEFFPSTWGPAISTYKLPYLKSNFKFKKFRLSKRDFSLYLGNSKMVYNNSYDYYIQLIKWLKLNKHIYMSQYKLDILNVIKCNKKEEVSNLINKLEIENYNYLINQYNKELSYLKYKQKILFNKFKYNETYLPLIIGFLQNTYNKNIEFNIISLKYFWLSTSILLQMVTTKVKDPKNRGKYSTPVDYAMEKVRVPILSKNKLAGEAKPYIGTQNIKLDEFFIENKNDINEFLLTNSTQSTIWSDNNIDALVLSNLENKTIVGISIKTAGRLTKRYKAQRAITRLRNKGTLKNVYSAHRNYSSSLLRGHNNINVEKVRIDSKVRIGSFGLTGWIASY